MDHYIIKIVSKILFAPILLFALYVQFHGDYSPGGGFQAGVVFAAGLILYAIGFGIIEFRKLIPRKTLRILMMIGIYFYFGTGVINMFLGGEFLNYTSLYPESTHHAGQHYGIILVEIGVGITVAATMILIFDAIAGRNIKNEETDIIKNV